MSRAIHVVGRLIKLTTARETYEYGYTEGSRLAEAAGFNGFLSFPGLNQVYQFDALPPFFSNRVMTPRRADFRQYVTELALTVENAVPLAMLSRYGGRRQTIPNAEADVLELVPEQLVDELGRAMQTDPSTVVVVERVNPPPSPYQHRLLCRWSTSSSAAPYADPSREPRSPRATILRRMDSTGTDA